MKRYFDVLLKVTTFFPPLARFYTVKTAYVFIHTVDFELQQEPFTDISICFHQVAKAVFKENNKRSQKRVSTNFTLSYFRSCWAGSGKTLKRALADLQSAIGLTTAFHRLEAESGNGRDSPAQATLQPSLPPKQERWPSFPSWVTSFTKWFINAQTI